MNEIYKTQNIRKKRYLYSLGFDYDVEYTTTGAEIFCFPMTDSLSEALNFYTKIRQNNRNI